MSIRLLRLGVVGRFRCSFSPSSNIASLLLLSMSRQTSRGVYRIFASHVPAPFRMNRLIIDLGIYTFKSCTVRNLKGYGVITTSSNFLFSVVVSIYNVDGVCQLHRLS